MIKLLGKIPNTVTLACSGGPDSMAALDFLMRGRKRVKVAHFDHGTEHGSKARKFVHEFCIDKSIPITIGTNIAKKNAGESWESFWRDQRYRFFNSIDGPIITVHHLNDVGEWWLFTSSRGNPRLTPYRNGKITRPFLMTPKSEFESWCERFSVPYVTDPGNFDLKFARSRIRNNIMPEILKVNPGFLTVMRKKILAEFKRENEE